MMASRALDNRRAGKERFRFQEAHNAKPGAQARRRELSWRHWRRIRRDWMRRLLRAIQQGEEA